jgi:hypothetical protein
MFLADASPFLNRDVTHGALLVMFLLGLMVAHLLTKGKEKSSE